MEIIHKVISVPDDHKVVLMLPKNIPVGDVEVVVIINPKKLVETVTHGAHSSSHAHSSSSSTSLRDAAISKLASLFDEQQQAQHHQDKNT
jgi:S1-C subfamily serine protease